jgi:sigma-54 specific flagellar transcriptional regulator A
MPPLRERPEDIVELAQHFLAQYAAESGTVEKTLSFGAVELLQSYAWPGNIRELENIVRSVALFCEGSVIDVRDFDEYRELFQEGPVSGATGASGAAVATGSSGSSGSSGSAIAAGASGSSGSSVKVAVPMPVQPLAPPPPTTSPPGSMPMDEAAVRQALDGELLSQIFEQGVPLPELKRRIQEQAIARALRLTKGNITRAAEVLGMRRPRLSQIINGSEELKSLCQGVIR